MSHGGARIGAGAPRGGVSETRRLLVGALHRGLEIAGRAKGLQGNAQEVAAESAARIASDMILAGQGSDVLKLLALTAHDGPRSGDGSGDSPLMAALKKLPGMQSVRDSSLDQLPAGEGPGATRREGLDATDGQSDGDHVQPFFTPQRVLTLDVTDAEYTVVEPSATAAAASTTPPPPAEAAGASHPVSGVNLENSNGEDKAA